MNTVKERIKLQLTVPFWKQILTSMKTDVHKKVILIGTPVHGNLGDHAIAIEEKIFLEENFSDYHFYEVCMPMYHLKKKQLRKYVSDRDIIFISGGGWMGNLWIHNENVIREIILDYSNNQIVIFPQTIFYTEDIEGKRECDKTRKIFAGHKKLLFYLREQRSYDFVKENFSLNGSSKVILCPDMVLYAKFSSVEGEHKENVINVCLRKDREAATGDYIQFIEQLAKEYNVVSVSTVIPHIIPLKNREKELYKMWKVFSDAEITITDRLHAMLFSILNGTPCIALDNKTGKVFGVANWIINTNMVILVNSLEEVWDKIRLIKDQEYSIYRREVLTDYYIQMVEEIRKGCDM